MKCSKFSQCYYQTKNLKTLNSQIFEAECICNQGYDTFSLTGENDPNAVKCCYKLKEVYLAFIYEVIIGFGFGYLYLENYNYFFIKFIFQTSIFCIVCFSGYCINFDYHGKNKDRHVKNVIYRTCNVWNFILVAIFIVWKIIDFFIFGLNLVKDTNRMRLYNEW